VLGSGGHCYSCPAVGDARRLIPQLDKDFASCGRITGAVRINGDDFGMLVLRSEEQTEICATY